MIAGQLRSLVEEQTGGTVCDDYRWDLLRRHHWNKKAPRPQHPQAEAKVKEQREAFKKSTPALLCKTNRSSTAKGFL